MFVVWLMVVGQSKPKTYKMINDEEGTRFEQQCFYMRGLKMKEAIYGPFLIEGREYCLQVKVMEVEHNQRVI